MGEAHIVYIYLGDSLYIERLVEDHVYRYAAYTGEWMFGLRGYIDRQLRVASWRAERFSVHLLDDIH